MKSHLKKLSLLVFFTASFGSAYGQPEYIKMESKEQITSALERHTIMSKGGLTPNVLLTELMFVMEREGPEALGLNATDDRESILLLRDVNIEQIQQNTLKPYYDQICGLLYEDQKDVVAMAVVFSEAKLAEEEATTQAYVTLTESLNSRAFEATEALQEGMISAVSFSMTVDWPKVAAEIPDYSLSMFERLCNRHTNKFVDDGLSEAFEKFASQQSDTVIRSN